MQSGWARISGLGLQLLPLARWVGRAAPLCLTHGVLVLSFPSAALRVRGVPGLLAPVHRCARVVCCVVSAVSGATWLLFTNAPARCGVMRVRRPGPLGSRSPVCLLGVFCCVCGVLGHLAPVHRCARSVCCFACAVSWAAWLLFTGVPNLSFVLFVRCPWPLGSWPPVCPPGLSCCEAGSDPRGRLWVTWGVYLCAGKPPLADIILSHPPYLTQCDSVIGLAIPATSGHIQYRGAASGDLHIRISGINRVLLS